MPLRNADAPDRREPAERRPSRRATRPALRHRRPTLLLGALLAGGVAAAVVGVGGGAPESADPTSVLAPQDPPDTAAEATEVLAQAAISEAEAQVRLQVGAD